MISSRTAEQYILTKSTSASKLEFLNKMPKLESFNKILTPRDEALNKYLSSIENQGWWLRLNNKDNLVRELKHRSKYQTRDILGDWHFYLKNYGEINYKPIIQNLILEYKELNLTFPKSKKKKLYVYALQNTQYKSYPGNTLTDFLRKCVIDIDEYLELNPHIPKLRYKFEGDILKCTDLIHDRFSDKMMDNGIHLRDSSLYYGILLRVRSRDRILIYYIDNNKPQYVLLK